MVLPADILANVLSRLPVKTILHCKCVCKRWSIILSEPYFAELHLSRSTEGLIFHPVSNEDDSDTLKLVEIDDKSDHHDVRHDPIMRFDLGLGIDFSDLRFSGSVNGLICLWYYFGAAAYICNPITREFINIQYQETGNLLSTETHGFGFVAASNQYKVVRFYSTLGSDSKLICEIYTLGTGKWRSLGHVPFEFSVCHDCTSHFYGIFVGGDLHWLICDPEDTDNLWGCSLDLEKEKFHLTPYVPGGGIGTLRNLGMLNGCLCICEVRRLESQFVIWVMKEYGRKESWSKEIVIRYNHNFGSLYYENVYPLKVLKDGTILLVCCGNFLYSYHPRTKKLQRRGLYTGPPLQKLDIFSGRAVMDAMVYVQSFIRLKSFTSEKISVF